AFRVMESSRAIVLQNALNRATAFGSAGISDSLLKVENGLMRQRVDLIQKLENSNATKSFHDSLNKEILLANNREVDFQNQLKKSSPNYFSVRYESPPKLSEIQKFLADHNSIYLEYLW